MNGLSKPGPGDVDRGDRGGDRGGDAGDDAAALAQAAQAALALQPHVGAGLNARTYPPEAWAVLARALARAHHDEEAQACRQQAVAWIRDIALPQVPAAAREAFLFRNPVNRAWLCGAA